MDFDIKMTTMVVVVYLLYFFVFEIVLCGSPGKRWLGGYLLNINNEKIKQGVILLRAAIRGVLSIAAIYGIHYLLGLTYYHVMFALLLLIDIPLFICYRSLIDLSSGAYYLEKGDPIITTDAGLNNEITENSINAENDMIFTEKETKEEEAVFESGMSVSACESGIELSVVEHPITQRRLVINKKPHNFVLTIFFIFSLFFPFVMGGFLF